MKRQTLTSFSSFFFSILFLINTESPFVDFISNLKHTVIQMEDPSSKAFQSLGYFDTTISKVMEAGELQSSRCSDIHILYKGTHDFFRLIGYMVFYEVAAYSFASC